MRHALLLCVAVVPIAIAALPGTSGEPAKPNRIAEAFYDKKGKSLYLSKPGDIAQLTVKAAMAKGKIRLRTLKVEVEGEVVSVLAVVENPTRDSAYDIVSCLLTAAKRGSAKVTVTPILEDGTTMEAHTWIIQVGPIPK